MDGGAWSVTVHEIAESDTTDFTFTFMAYDSVYITFMNWQNYSDEDQITGFQWLGLFGNIRE